MANNISVLQDEDSEYPDWIELYNASESSVDLTGCHLTDTEDNLTRWTFPARHLPAGGFLVIFASGKDRSGSELHTNFRLSSDGEYLALVRADGTTIEHEYFPTYPEQFPDISYGVQTHGTNPTLRAIEAGYLIVHTPGTTNLCIPAPHPLYSDDSVARVDIVISQSTWDELMYSPTNDAFQTADVRFRHGDLDVMATNAGIKCRGASTREMQPRSFTIDFNAFVPGQQMLGMEKLYFNATAIDPSTVRSRLIDDLHGAAGLTSPYANCVALVINGPESDRGSETGGSFFDAIRCNTQPIDKGFLRQRYRNSHGNLYDTGGAASLEFLGPEGSSYQNLAYELQVADSGDTTFNDLADFIAILNQTPDIDFPHAMMQVFDVDDFLKCLALDVLTGNYDNYWIATHNFKLYRHPDTRRWIYIPYDYDLTFGIDWSATDWSSQHIDNWNDIPEGACTAPLATRILAVPEFKNRYRFYMKQMMETVYSNAILDPYLFHCRSAMTQTLPFDSGGIADMKAAERQRYTNDWPNWTYDQFYQSFTQAPVFFTSHGLTEFIENRRATALSQMSRGFSMAPILSDFILLPTQPRTNDSLLFSVRAVDDVSITTVELHTTFQTGITNVVAMTLQADGSYAAPLPAFGTTGTLHYLIRAMDNIGQTTFHPYGGSSYAASIEIGESPVHLVITELNYNPYPPTPDEIAAGFTDAQDFEFVELLNAGDIPLDLTGDQITEGIGATAPAFTLDAGEYAVFVKNFSAFSTRYSNTSVRIIGSFMGQLSNAGETLRLEGADGIIATLTYRDSGNWPDRADGDGSSLEILDFHGDSDVPENWRSSSEYGGSPGTSGSGPDSRVVINEVLTHTDSPLGDKIELYNTTDDALAIGGWTLSDSKANYQKYAIPAGTILPANSYIVFDETNHFNTSGGVASNDFSLNGTYGDELYLLQADEQGNLIRFVDHVEFGAMANGESLGRWPDDAGRLYPMQCPTLGAVNSGPRVGPLVISEIMYAPPSGSNHLEFIEIDNPSAASEDLTHWELDGGVTFAFPSNTLLPAGAQLVILSFNPNTASNSALLADVHSTYDISTNVALVGGYEGILSNDGERIRLLRTDEPPLEEPSYFPLLIEDEVEYGSVAPWPFTSAGQGASLSRLSPAAWGDAPSSWTPANPPTPGSAQSVLTEYQKWAANKDIPGLCAINPLSGLSYAEEFLLQTNGTDNLHHVSSSGPYSLYSHIPMISCGISNQLEVSTDLLNPSAWRSAFGSELLFLSNQTYRVNVPSEVPFFIRLQLIPLE